MSTNLLLTNKHRSHTQHPLIMTCFTLSKGKKTFRPLALSYVRKKLNFCLWKISFPGFSSTEHICLKIFRKINSHCRNNIIKAYSSLKILIKRVENTSDEHKRDQSHKSLKNGSLRSATKQSEHYPMS